jgi:hypothetical protein
VAGAFFFLQNDIIRILFRSQAVKQIRNGCFNILEGVDPHQQAMLQSLVDQTQQIPVYLNARFVDSLTNWPLTPAVPQYFSLNLRIAWQYKKFEFSIVGKNLLSARHVEFVASQIPRSIYGKIVSRF